MIFIVFGSRAAFAAVRRRSSQDGRSNAFVGVVVVVAVVGTVRITSVGGW